MPPNIKQDPITIEDSDTASDLDDIAEIASANDSKKRKAACTISEKVSWTDESDTVPAKPKKRRQKRKSARSGRRSKNIDGNAVNEDEEYPDHDTALDSLPEYVLQRRQQFDAEKKAHHEAALMVPPSYEGIHLGPRAVDAALKERPDFEESSGIKPCRRYQDIVLPESAGVIPAPIAQYLRDYQVDGVRFLHRKFVYQEGALLGDDMGLGKTVQVVAFLTAAFGKTGDDRDERRLRQLRFTDNRWYPQILIICPGSLIMNWKNELNRWGWWHVDAYHGTNKDDVLGSARAGMIEIMITTYETYKNGRSHINMVKWDAVIADECHRLKDKSSETTKAMNEVNALCRIGLTGTAIQNKYEELWTLLDWTNPGHFGTKAEWSQTISKPLAVGQSHEATEAQLSLARQTARKLVVNLLPRFFMRRMKSLIAHQLPKKTDRVVFCPLTDEQRAAYERFLESHDLELIKSISDICEHGKKQGWCCRRFTSSGKPWQSIVFPAMMTLQKMSNHLTLLVPNTTDLVEKQESELRTLQNCLPDSWKTLYQNRHQITSLVNPEFCGKWKVLKKLLKFWHGNGDKVLVFSHSVRLLRILHHLFTNTSYSVSFLDGSIKYEERQAIVDTFNSDPTQFVFLISTKAGGVGLNITSANKVVIIDPHWNPSYDLQAQDRAYRIGQTRDVEVFRLISLGTVEEVVYARQIYKQQQANIGYTASSERRYFRGVQQDSDRKGEIFGLANIFTYHKDSGLLQDIVNKTNIAEAKVGVSMADVDMEQAADEEEDLGVVKKEEEDGAGVREFAALLTADDDKTSPNTKANKPKPDVVQAILASAGVDYTHDNAEVIGSSKVEQELSKRAEMGLYTDDGQNALFANESVTALDALHTLYQPPEDVCLRQFTEMACEFGFINATEFALIVEGWSQEARTNCLDTFYKRRKAKAENARVKMEQGQGQQLKEETEDVKPSTEALKEEAEDVKFKAEAPVKSEALKREEVKEEIKTEGIKTEEIKKEEMKTEDVKSEVKGEVKQEVKAETKREAPEDIKTDDVKVEIKQEALKVEQVKEEDLKGIVKTDGDGESKRTSIFLLDDDDDDDEL